MTDFTIDAIMRRDYPVLSPDTPIRLAVKTLLDNAAPGAPVTDSDGRLVGLLTQKDCFRPVLQAAYHRDWRGTVAEHMSGTVVTVAPGENVVHAAELFLSHPHRQFPVTDGAKLVGMLYRTNVLACLARDGEV